jgi:peroxiredoxin Q/BCP
MPVTFNKGDIAPDFTLADQAGTKHTLSTYKGETVVLYFYPRDDTPGCTKQACGFRDNYTEVIATGTHLFGISTDSKESHDKFREKYSLPFPLLVDHEASVSTTYGAWGEKVLYGRKSIGMTRCTFIIGPDGKFQKVWKRAQAAKNPEAVLKELQST